MENDSPMYERILKTLANIITSNVHLEEFSIIPSEGNTTNKSPVIYEENNIGIESWCVKHIYKYAYIQLFQIRNASTKKQNFSRIRDINHLLIGALLINPDVLAFWNMKRQLVQADLLTVDQELLFTKIVLSYKSKSNETFAYRRWLLKAPLKQKNDAPSLRNLAHNELAVCERAAARNPNNYHAWTHRIWCLQAIDAKNRDLCEEIVANELEFSRNWVSKHVSEHTGYHYRQLLFNYIRNYSAKNTIFDFYVKEMAGKLSIRPKNDAKSVLAHLFGKEKLQKTVEEAKSLVNIVSLIVYDLLDTLPMIIADFHNHESLWYHRRYLVYHLVQIMYEYHGIEFNSKCVRMDEMAVVGGSNIVNSNSLDRSEGVKEPKLLKSQPNKVKSCYLYQFLMQCESSFIRNATGNFDVEFGKRHTTWLKFVIGMQLG